jgi:osmotically-inducible protein OsmY
MHKTDVQLKNEVEQELASDPKVNAAQIGVSVEQGSVSLRGTVDTYAAKWAAEDAVKRVNGVFVVAQDLAVKLIGAHSRDDSEIAATVQRALEWDVYIPKTVTAEVRDGSVTLNGYVHSNHERQAAERAVRNVTGVVSVFDSIRLSPKVSSVQVKEKIEAALRRQAKADTKSIHVETSGDKVTLTGHASSWQSIEDAAHAAWAVPGVTEVIDQVKIQMTS